MSLRRICNFLRLICAFNFCSIIIGSSRDLLSDVDRRISMSSSSRDGTWTFRTLDYSYHYWTIRTMLQDWQKLTFPAKMCLCIQCESKDPPLNFSDIFPKRLGIFSPNFICRLYVPIYGRLQIFIQLSTTWRSYAILSATTIICSKCPPSAETHAGWSHLMWHNFVKVKVEDN